MQLLKSIFSTSDFVGLRLRQKPFIFLLFHFSSSSSSSVSVLNTPLFDYLVNNLNFTRTQALSVSNRFPNMKSIGKAQSVANFFQSLGFSNAQIALAISKEPQILVANVDKNLRPKAKVFQDLGISRPGLCELLSKNSPLLCCSLEKKLIPSIQILKKVFGDRDNEVLVQVFNRGNGLISRDSLKKVSRNIEYLESCGIVGSQLSNLLKRQPRIFKMQESALRDVVSRASDMGLSTDRMLVHAIHTLSCMNDQTFKKKWELLKSYGFSENDCLVMFRKCPVLFRTSMVKIELGIEFFMNVVKVDKNVLVSRPNLLMSSLGNRVIPRYKVLQIIKSKKLMKREPSFLYILDYSEEEFLEFISRFTADVVELLVAYKGHLLQTSSDSEEVEEEEET
ncbi:Mitochodrial transcription termination factor-related protein [Corchorus capsularis]|uniref:Mitochodrial transcription termination factor-related protein n=1 Tax=Corchorus capsularis TaxID=210143 RepID=A0A1R3GD72_COCAP|nr:Mitochodrial transcription termination factor-related protein [Corchorus capsularis]